MGDTAPRDGARGIIGCDGGVVEGSEAACE